MKNSRGHTPLDLATEPKTKELILRATKTKACENRECRSKFDFKNVRFYCEVSTKFFCKNCSTTMWVYENHDSEEKERPVCFSLVVQKKISDHEARLQEAVESFDFKRIDSELSACQGVDIKVKLRKQAEILHLKLEHELKIEGFLNKNLSHINYKDIRKDVQRINDMVQDAQNLEIDLNPNLI